MSRLKGFRCPPPAVVRALRALEGGPRTAQDVARIAGHESVTGQRRTLEACAVKGYVVRVGGAWELAEGGRDILARDNPMGTGDNPREVQ